MKPSNLIGLAIVLVTFCINFPAFALPTKTKIEQTEAKYVQTFIAKHGGERGNAAADFAASGIGVEGNFLAVILFGEDNMGMGILFHIHAATHNQCPKNLRIYLKVMGLSEKEANAFIQKVGKHPLCPLNPGN